MPRSKTPKLRAVEEIDTTSPKPQTRTPKQEEPSLFGAEILTVVDGSVDPRALLPPDMTFGQLREILVSTDIPEDILALLDKAGPDLNSVVPLLDAAGFFDEPKQNISNILDYWKPLTAARTTALDAELAGYEFLAMFVGPDGEKDFEPLVHALAAITSTRRREALLMARVLTKIGPSQVIPAAEDAARGLAAQGVKDPGWMDLLGRPNWSTSYGFADNRGKQRTLVTEFKYRNKPHLCLLLLDYRVGGGIKDCWFTDSTKSIMQQVRLAAMAGGFAFETHSAQETSTMLHLALAASPCPEEEDQIDNVQVYRDLVRARATLLPEPDRTAVAPQPSPTRRRGPDTHAQPGTIHRIKVTIKRSRPPIWRRLELPSAATLAELHLILQDAFDWDDSHLWEIRTRDEFYGSPELDARNPGLATLAEVAPNPGNKLHYTYDFGDDWEHLIVVEKVVSAVDGQEYPRCVAGRRASPPEDFGGIGSYEYALHVLADPTNGAHAEILERFGLRAAAEYEPEIFQAGNLNELWHS